MVIQPAVDRNHLDTEPNIEVQNSDTISTGSSIEQDRKMKLVDRYFEGSKEKQDGETHTSTDTSCR